MKKLIPLIVFLCVAVSAQARMIVPAPLEQGTYAELDGDNAFTGVCTFEEGIEVGGVFSRMTFDPNGEYISNEVDDIILFQGAGGATDQSIAFNLDGNRPEIYAPSEETIAIIDLLRVDPPIKDISSIPASGYFGLSVNTLLQPTVLTNNNAGGVLINNSIGGVFFDSGSVIRGGTIQNSAVTTAFGGLGDGGSNVLKTIGLTIIAASSLDIGGGFGGTYTTGDIVGLEIEAAKPNVVVSGDSTTLSLMESGSAVAGSQKIINIEEPTEGATNYQVVLEGFGAGAGIWFNGITTGCRVYTEATATNCASGTVIISGATTDLCGACN